MRQHLPSDDLSFTRRLDRIFGQLNAFLVAVAIGLAVLDFTFFVTERAVSALAEMSVQTGAQLAGTAAAQPVLRAGANPRDW